jgi:hypothetical protein
LFVKKREKQAYYGFDRSTSEIPPVVQDCLDFLTATKAYTVEGLFRYQEC